MPAAARGPMLYPRNLMQPVRTSFGHHSGTAANHPMLMSPGAAAGAGLLQPSGTTVGAVGAGRSAGVSAHALVPYGGAGAGGGSGGGGAAPAPLGSSLVCYSGGDTGAGGGSSGSKVSEAAWAAHAMMVEMLQAHMAANPHDPENPKLLKMLLDKMPGSVV